MDETFINELAVELRKLGTIHTVGEEWHSLTGEIPNGGVPYCGQEVTRETYAALWQYVQDKGLVKPEAEWQQLASSQNGNVAFYSDGDGATTFRMPKIVGYVKGASSMDDAGAYTKEGLPNHTHHIGIQDGVGNAGGGGYLPAYSTAAGSVIVNTGANGAQGNGIWTDRAPTGYDISRNQLTRASDDNPIYGNSSHVTPETSAVLFGVYAFGVITNAGALDATTLQAAIARVELEQQNAVKTVNGQTPTGGNISVDVGVTSVNGQSGSVTVDVPNEFNVKQNNPITNVADDTPNKWTSLGGGTYFFSLTNCVNNQPGQWGVVVSFCTGGDVFQIWKSQSSGAMYYRSGNSAGWGENWTQLSTGGGGGVSQRYNQSITVSRFEPYTTTTTVTGLTPLKPVFIGAKITNRANVKISFYFTSGTAINSSCGSDTHIEAYNSAIWFSVVPTGTSLAIVAHGGGDGDTTLDLVVYQ